MIGHISGWNYSLFIYAFSDSVEKFYQFQQGPFQNLKFVLCPSENLGSFFKKEHVKYELLNCKVVGYLTSSNIFSKASLPKLSCQKK